MEIINNYQEIINFYNGKLSHAQEEWEKSIRELTMLLPLVEEGWRGRAGEEVVLKLEEFRNGAKEPAGDMERVRSSLAALGLAIEEELRRLAEEEEKRRLLEEELRRASES